MTNISFTKNQINHLIHALQCVDNSGDSSYDAMTRHLIKKLSRNMR